MQQPYYYVRATSNKYMPAGQIVQSLGPLTSNDLLYCDGSSMPRDQFKELFAVIGTQWGSSGPNTFNLPDMRGKRNITCVLCHTEHSLLGYEIQDHPIFKNNLEYLEWLDEKATRASTL